MSWYLPVVEKWIDMLVEERQFSEKLAQRSRELLTRLHGLVERCRLNLPIPSVENEPLPLEESDAEATIALTWLAPPGRIFQLMYIEKLQKTRLRINMGLKYEDTDDPKDEQIVLGLLKMGVKQFPEPQQEEDAPVVGAQ